MRATAQVILSAVVGWVVIGAPVVAWSADEDQSTGEVAQKAAHDPQWLKEHPEARERMMHQKLEQMSPQERKQFLQEHPGARQEMAKEQWKHATPEEREQFLKTHPEARERMLHQKLEQMTPEQRKQFLQEHPEARQHMAQEKMEHRAQQMDHAGQKPGVHPKPASTYH